MHQITRTSELRYLRSQTWLSHHSTRAAVSSAAQAQRILEYGDYSAVVDNRQLHLSPLDRRCVDALCWLSCAIRLCQCASHQLPSVFMPWAALAPSSLAILAQLSTTSSCSPVTPSNLLLSHPAPSPCLALTPPAGCLSTQHRVVECSFMTSLPSQSASQPPASRCPFWSCLNSSQLSLCLAALL